MASKRKIANIITVIVIVSIASVGAVSLLQYMQMGNSTDAPPQFCTSDFVNLSKIKEISLFRSFQGHDYSDSYEHNLSMKHYFTPYSNVESVEVYSPIKGSVVKVSQEQNGVGNQVQIQVAEYPEYYVNIFHLDVTSGLAVGDSVEAGQQIGVASANQGTDIAVRKEGSFSMKLYSYFDTMTDNVFLHYQARGVTSRAELVRSAGEAKELSATYSFDNTPLNDWVILNPP